MQFELLTIKYRPNDLFERASKVIISTRSCTQVSTVTPTSTSLLAIAFVGCYIDHNPDLSHVNARVKWNTSVDPVFTSQVFLGANMESWLKSYQTHDY